MKSSFLLFIAMFSFNTMASRYCDKLELNWRVECNDEDAVCKSLNTCQKVRKSCPQTFRTQEGCEQLNECVQALHTNAQNREMNLCGYEWKYTFTQFKEICRLNIPNGSFMGNSCPGVNKVLDSNSISLNFDDPNFICEGHKVEYWKKRVSCTSAYEKYKAAIASGKCRNNEVEMKKVCSSAEDTLIAN